MQARATTDKAAQRLVVNSMPALREASGRLLSLWHEHKYLVLSIRPGRDRSLEQNRLWRSMYIRIAQVTQQGTDDEVWAYNKLVCGVPILRRDDEGFEAGWQQFFASLNFEQQLYYMGANPLFGPDGFPVTRLFGTKQGSEYTQRIADHYAPQGVFFDDLLRDSA